MREEAKAKLVEDIYTIFRQRAEHAMKKPTKKGQNRVMPFVLGS